MIYKAKHHFLAKGLFTIYHKELLWNAFHRVALVKEEGVLKKGPAVLIMNHFSWWDGFIAWQLNRKYFQKKFHIVMLEETYKRFWFFKFLGGIGISRSHSPRETLNYLSSILQDENNILVYYPEGKIGSNFSSKINFESGLNFLLKQAPSNLNICLVAGFIENLNHAKPSYYGYRKIISKLELADEREIVDIYQEHYTNSLKQQAKLQK